MSEQGQGRKDPGAEAEAEETGKAADGPGSADEGEAPSKKKKADSSPLMQAAAQAAEQAHGEDEGEADAGARDEGSGGGDEAQATADEEGGRKGRGDGGGEGRGADRGDAGEKPADAPDAGAGDGSKDAAAGADDDQVGGDEGGSAAPEVETEPPGRGDLDEGDGEDEDAPEGEAARDGIHIRFYGMTHVGLVRDHNEDNFMVADLTSGERDLPDDEVRSGVVGSRGIVLAVCDGMGGAAAGEVASQMAVDTVYEIMKAGGSDGDRDDFARRLVHAVEEAGGRIFSASKMDRTRRGMGTTATVAGLVDEVLFVGQVGDSRAYVLRNGEMGLITKDQSLVNQLIEAGQLSEEEAEAFEHSNIILQALGTTEEVNVDLTFLELRRGDRVMLCSDGLSGLVHPDTIRDVLVESKSLREACRRLIEMANSAGGHDNTTIVVADFTGEGLAPPEEAPVPIYQQYPLPDADETRRSSLPPRDTSMKQGGPKPGADVKRGSPWGAPSRGSEEQAQRTMRWWVVAAVLALALVGSVVAFSGPAEEVPAASKPAAPESSARSSGASAAEAEAVPVTVTTDVVGAELFVDGERYGAFPGDEDLEIELAPGAYHLEARSEGNVAASANLNVRDGEPAEVRLLLPEGRTGRPEDPQPEP
ncbi:MAG: protein phosphatase 2C domain-containing protein, partial [Myxococcota bacterium]